VSVKYLPPNQGFSLPVLRVFPLAAQMPAS